MTLELKTASAAETEKIGFDLAKSLDEEGRARAFIALRGEMGVGKTAFVRGFARFFDISGVRSPTYTVVNEYAGRTRIYHFDMYRLEGEDDLLSIGFDDYVSKQGFCICEWSENVEEFIPEDAISVTIERTPDGEDARRITVKG